MYDRKKLADILSGASELDNLQEAWDTTEAADELTVRPAGTYKCGIRSGELTKSSKGTPGYKITFEVIEGAHDGRRFWHDVWLSPAAMAMAKRDLAKLGITSPAQLDRPMPPGMLADVKVAVRKEDDGVTMRNRVVTFTVTGFAKPDEFAPADDPDGKGVASI